jgi:hypothetical protein
MSGTGNTSGGGGTGGGGAGNGGGGGAGAGGAPCGAAGGGSVSFPATSILDRFDRPEMANWSANPGQYDIISGHLVYDSIPLHVVRPLTWLPVYDADQEVFAKYVDSARSMELVLKAQDEIALCDFISIEYRAEAQRLNFGYCVYDSSTLSFNEFGPSTVRQLAIGEVLGARVFATGRVQMFVNDTLVLEATAPALPFMAGRGRIGVMTDGDVTHAAWDDFGGGSVVCP